MTGAEHDLILKAISDLGREVSTLAAQHETRAETTDILLSEVRDRLSRLRCEAHAEALHQYGERMDRLRADISELQSRPPRPPTGEIEAVARDTTEEVTGEIRVDMLREVAAAAKAAVRDREREREEESELRAKRVERWLRIVAMVLPMLGVGGAAALVRSCIVQEQMVLQSEQQAKVLQSVSREVKTLVPPDAGRR